MDEFLRFTQNFYQFTGIDLQSYKRPQMERRLTFLRDKLGYHDYETFLEAMKRQPELLHQLLDRMTINVSEFFRNPERWDSLTHHLPALAASRTGSTFHAWSAACSTGEEPYTLAMVLQETLGTVPFHIQATDIDKKVLATAAAGAYKADGVKGIPAPYLKTYFSPVSSGYQAGDSLKRKIEFRLHNLLADPYPKSLDLIICRNVLIYFTEEAKQQVVSGLAGSLRPGGLLFVGSTEQFMRAEIFGLTSVAPFLYQRSSR